MEKGNIPTGRAQRVDEKNEIISDQKKPTDSTMGTTSGKTDTTSGQTSTASGQTSTTNGRVLQLLRVTREVLQ